MTTRIAEWLKSARLSQRHPETGRPWSQEYAVERIRDEADWPTLYRPNYVGYENGRGMEPETLERFVAFWARYGVEAPDLAPEPAPLSLEERAVAAAERQAAAAEAQLLLMARQVAAIERIALRLSGSEPDPRAVEETQAWALAELAEALPPRPGQAGGRPAPR